MIVAIVGNKIDLEDQRAVSKEAVENYLKGLSEAGLNPIYRECSTKSGQGVHEIFEEICKRLIEMTENGMDLILPSYYLS